MHGARYVHRSSTHAHRSPPPPERTVHVVERVRLEVVLVARVGGAGCEQQVHAVPQERKGGGVEDERRQDARVVVLRRVSGGV